jgi:hypothetical protein
MAHTEYGTRWSAVASEFAAETRRRLHEPEMTGLQRLLKDALLTPAPPDTWTWRVGFHVDHERLAWREAYEHAQRITAAREEWPFPW